MQHSGIPVANGDDCKIIIDISIIDVATISLRNMDKLEDNVLYLIDRCFRAYNLFAQQQVRKSGFNITIDQWLILKNVSEHPDITQNEIAALVLKDNASITRIIQNLVGMGFLIRENHAHDRRRAVLRLTPAGKRITADVNKIALKNRAQALKSLDKTEINAMKASLRVIIENSTNTEK